jgi:hypothetical protein
MAKRESRLPPVAIVLVLASLAAFSLFLVGTTVLPAVTCEEISDGDHFIWLPKNVTRYFEGDRINLHFLLPQGKTMDVHGTVKDSGIENVVCGSPREHDYFVSMTWIEALALTGSNKPITDFMAFRQQGRVVVAPNSVEKLEKLSAAERTLPASDAEPVPAWIQALFDKYRASPPKRAT